MQKKLESELMSIAHEILQMKNRNDLKALKQKAYETYEKLAVLSYIERFVAETPENTKTVEELASETFGESANNEDRAIKMTENIDEQPSAPQEKSFVKKKVTKAKKTPKKESDHLQSSLEIEFGPTVSLDVTTDLFENATRVDAEKKIQEVVVGQKNLQIDLNDRIAFVKHLFVENQEDFNRVVSQINTLSTEEEGLNFLKMVKKEYDWKGKEDYEERLILLIQRKFN